MLEYRRAPAFDLNQLNTFLPMLRPRPLMRTASSADRMAVRSNKMASGSKTHRRNLRYTQLRQRSKPELSKIFTGL